jgi:hypothetical protein
MEAGLQKELRGGEGEERKGGRGRTCFQVAPRIGYGVLRDIGRYPL